MHAHTEGFHHEAFFYADTDELLAGTVPFVRAGMQADEAVLIAMPRPSLEHLQDALGGEVDGVQFLDMEMIGRNPARIISAWRDFVDEHLTDDRGVRGIGEPIWPGRSSAEVDECERHESLLNLAFAHTPPWLLMCPYNTTELDEKVLMSAESNHPVLSRANGGGTPSASYSTPAGESTTFSGWLDTPSIAAELYFTIEHLSDVRRFVADHSRRAGLEPTRIEDLVLAANEVATNSVRHAGGNGDLSMWWDDGVLVCDIRDGGQIDQPLVGRIRPGSDQLGGRGMWLVNQLCDLVQIRVGESGNLVRLQMSMQRTR